MLYYQVLFEFLFLFVGVLAFGARELWLLRRLRLADEAREREAVSADDEAPRRAA